MIKQGVSNYFKSFKYFFTSLGIIALFFVLGMSILIPMMSNSVSTLANGAAEILQESSIDWEAMQSSFVASAGEVDFNNPTEAIKTLTSSDWLKDTLGNAVKAAFGSLGSHEQQIQELVNNAINELTVAILLFISLFVLGMIVGLVATQWQIRRDMTGSSFGKRLLATIVDSILYTALIVLCLYLNTLWNIGFVFSILISLLIVNFVSLLESYIVSGRKKARFIQIVNFKNILKMLLVDTFIFAITIGILLLVYVISNWAVAVFVAIPLVEISFMVIQLNADNYVKNMNVAVPKNEGNEQSEQPAKTEQNKQSKKQKSKKEK